MPYFCTATDCASRLSSSGYALRVDDDAASITQCLQTATNRVLLYCEEHYDRTALQTNANAGGMVNDWTTDCAVYRLCKRRANPAPESVVEDYKEAISELEMVQAKNMVIPETAYRYTAIPRFSNIRVDPGYLYKKIRVETPISDTKPTAGYAQVPEWNALYSFEFILMILSVGLAFLTTGAC